MMPDIAHAKKLCKHLREVVGLDTNYLPAYFHAFPAGRTVSCNLYPVEYLGVFRKLFSEKWMPEKAAEYFKKRDPAALAVLDQMMTLTASKPMPPMPPLSNAANSQPY